ncbi:heavy metal translocating P-type ATPase [Terrimonas pollutisoli]|uniref:heavy metal translocating P-type ATPase n=1 Tax=Terrimonas pollutisoli TaxID=3034147 RepID=UPI0023EC2778|nr:cation-translocating P-type ATPase [Terrimonas sp. H1YJ31]
MEKIQWKVEGMDCNTCAINIHRYLEKQGMKNVKVNFATGDVIFDKEGAVAEDKISKGINDLGYKVVDEKLARDGHSHSHKHEEGGRKIFHSHLQRFWFCFPFTAILMLDMIPGVHFHWLMNPWLQLVLTLPVFIVGMSFFGKSAWKSIRNGMPNMNVLIAIGALSSFIYSLYGTLTGQAEQYMFYETTATIITLVFLGNYMEEASVKSTQKALNKLAQSQKVMANMITYDDQKQEHIFPVESDQLRSGDLILIKSGEQVPADCKILWGEADVNEAIITGESIPVHKVSKDKLIGGSILVNGTIKGYVTAAGNDTVLSGIINLVKQAQGEKPPVQQLADKISAVFIPVVLGIAVVTLIANWIILKDFTPSLMRSIAVLVIACPCAMGLATPAAIAVGLGRGARNGILFRNATSLESFKNIQQVVFDKTGTLTTGEFIVGSWQLTANYSVTEEEFKRIVFSLEKYSNHPIAKSIAKEWKTKDEIRWKKIEEIKGLGMRAEDKESNTYTVGSFKVAEKFTKDDGHNVYVIKNDELLGWVDVKDELRPEAKAVVDYLHGKNIKTILLSGDRYAKTKALGDQLGIDEVIAEQTPEQKLEKIAELSSAVPTVMVGDGINDAPALAKATVGISMSDASQIAMQTAQVVLMNHGLKKLPMALGLGRHTFLTIKQNLFWAFAYNIVAIPVAALGFLKPGFAALVMGLSDVVLAINSGRLFVKKVD